MSWSLMGVKGLKEFEVTSQQQNVILPNHDPFAYVT